MKKNLMTLSSLTVLLAGCATLTEDAMTPIAVSFSNGLEGECTFTNKRGMWKGHLPEVITVRKSDDALRYECEVEGSIKEVTGFIPSSMGAKIVASAVFLDFGIVDSITDKHRKYPESFVIPVKRTKQD